MKLLVTGHREFKLQTYDINWIRQALKEVVGQLKEKHGYVRGYAGMASGVDLWFCESCKWHEVNYVACIPFEGQEETMDEWQAHVRQIHIQDAIEVRKVKNSWMVEECDMGIVVWDGNKGGTHNVVQQLVEKKKSFIWINPVAQSIYFCVNS